MADCSLLNEAARVLLARQDCLAELLKDRERLARVRGACLRSVFDGDRRDVINRLLQGDIAE